MKPRKAGKIYGDGKSWEFVLFRPQPWAERPTEDTPGCSSIKKYPYIHGNAMFSFLTLTSPCVLWKSNILLQMMQCKPISANLNTFFWLRIVLVLYYFYLQQRLWGLVCTLVCCMTSHLWRNWGRVANKTEYWISAANFFVHRGQILRNSRHHTCILEKKFAAWSMAVVESVD